MYLCNGGDLGLSVHSDIRITNYDIIKTNSDIIIICCYTTLKNLSNGRNIKFSSNSDIIFGIYDIINIEKDLLTKRWASLSSASFFADGLETSPSSSSLSASLSVLISTPSLLSFLGPVKEKKRISQ